MSDTLGRYEWQASGRPGPAREQHAVAAIFGINGADAEIGVLSFVVLALRPECSARVRMPPTAT
jgi:hypothetical protein